MNKAMKKNVLGISESELKAEIEKMNPAQLRKALLDLLMLIECESALKARESALEAKLPAHVNKLRKRIERQPDIKKK